MIILGLTGSFAAGKGAVVEYLVKERAFQHFSASGFITEEIVRRGMDVNRDSMTIVGNEMRQMNGPAYIINTLYARAQETGKDSIIESLRAVAEVRRIKELGGYVLGIDADPKLRYERALARKSEKDSVTYEEWRKQEETESNAKDPTKQNIFGALSESDFVIQNNGTLEELHRQLSELLATVTKT